MNSALPIVEAKRAAALKWPVFPLASKVPMQGSHSFYDATTDLAIIDKWAAEYPKANWGLPTGQRSGVVVLEVDRRRRGHETLAKVQNEFGPLPATVRVISPSGSPHIYFGYSESLKSRMDPFGPGVELKADGNYVVLAGGHRKDGKRYRYERGASPDDLPLAPLPTWVNEHRTAAEIAEAIISADSAYLRSSLPISAAMSLDDVIRCTQPKNPGERNARLLELARGVRFNCKMDDADDATLEGILRKWHALALSIIKTKKFRDSWYDFRHAFTEAKFPLGIDVVDIAASCVDLDALPAAAEQYADDEMRVLVCLCHELSKLTGGLFFLSSHDAAARLKVEPKTAWRMLRTLCDDGVLAVAKQGNEFRANRYRWIGAKCFIVEETRTTQHLEGSKQ